MIRRPPRSTLFPTRRSSDLSAIAPNVALARGYFSATEKSELRSLGFSREQANVPALVDRKSTRLNSSHANISYAVFCLKKKQPRPPTSLILPRGFFRRPTLA